MEMNTLYGTERMRILKTNMLERFSALFQPLKEGKPIPLWEDESVEIRCLKPEEIDEERLLLGELYLKDDVALTVEVHIDPLKRGKIAQEILATAEIENIQPKKKHGKLVFVGIMLFAYYTSQKVLQDALSHNGRLNRDVLEKGYWLYELFYPYPFEEEGRG